jgi:hypothetical protein
VTFYERFGGDVETVADHFPTPFNDLQGNWQDYYRYAKAMSYLEYGDGIAPFDRDFFNFRPAANIPRKYVLKVLLEAFNVPIQTTSTLPSGWFSDVPLYNDMFDYVYTAWQLGIVQGSGGNFRPEENAQRYEVFVMLHRIMTNCSECQTDAPTMADFYFPGNYKPENFALAFGLEVGNFNHYTKSSFTIPGRGFNLDFTHSYNSYTTELPDQFYPIAPLSRGWTHTYNAYMLKIEGLTSEFDRSGPMDPSIHTNMKTGHTSAKLKTCLMKFRPLPTDSGLKINHRLNTILSGNLPVIQTYGC